MKRHKPGKVWPAEKRTEALALLEEHGLAEAAKRSGVHKTTISRWAKRAGVKVEVQLSAQKRTEVARAELERLRAESTVDQVTKLDRLIDLGVGETIRRLEENAEDIKVAELVGVWTRAFHDRQLLTGRATENVATRGPLEDGAVAELRARIAKQTANLAQYRGEALAVPDGVIDVEARAEDG